MGSVVAVEQLISVRKQLRRRKRTVVFTNGVFDILHRGHVDYLEKAKALGDVLIVGMNTDRSVRRIKGPGRPIVGEQDRAYLLAHLTPVDYVCLFNQNTPKKLIAAIVPDVLVKGADWNLEQIVGRDIVEGSGGRVATIAFLPERSTTAIIERILERFGTYRGARP